MKNRVKSLFNILLIITLLFSYSNQVFGQEKVNISTGFGIPELLNLGLRFHVKQTQFGISFGTIPIKDESIISISSDVYYHFGGFSELSNTRPWYGRIGLNYFRDEIETQTNKYLYLNLRIGRDFNISKRIGIEIDTGIIFQLFHERIRKEPSIISWFEIEAPALPSFGIGLFYRL